MCENHFSFFLKLVTLSFLCSCVRMDEHVQETDAVVDNDHDGSEALFGEAEISETETDDDAASENDIGEVDDNQEDVPAPSESGESNQENEKQKSHSENGKEDDTLEKEKAAERDLMFNKDKRNEDETGYINRAEVEKKCEAAKPCYSSNLVVPVCGSDGKVYLNPGVFQCAQRCKKKEGEEDLKVSHFGPCKDHVLPTTTSTTPKTTAKTTPKHKTSDNRIRIEGSVTKFFKWLGFHVHDDGGVYIADEKEMDSWWNI